MISFEVAVFSILLLEYLISIEKTASKNLFGFNVEKMQPVYISTHVVIFHAKSIIV